MERPVESGIGRRLFGRRSSEPRMLGVSYGLCVVAALGLFVAGILFPTSMRDIRASGESFAAPVWSAVAILATPVRTLGENIAELVGVYDEVEQLRRENRELRGWKWRAGELERKLKDMSALVKTVQRHGSAFVTARVLAVSPGPARHLVMIDAGAGHGIRVGDGVINGDGFVGIIADVTPQTARVRLLDDRDLRVDVVVGRDGVLAQLTGDGAGLARLDLALPESVLHGGDQVVTAGTWPGVPRGLKVGMIVNERNGLRVAPVAALGRLEFVSVLLQPRSSRDRIVGVSPPARGLASPSDETQFQPMPRLNEDPRAPE